MHRQITMRHCNFHKAERGVEKSGYIEMQGNELKLNAVRELSNVVEETLSANNLQKTDIDWLVPHQANLRIITATAKKIRDGYVASGGNA